MSCREALVNPICQGKPELFYQFLGCRGADGETLLPEPIALRLPDFVRAWESDPQNAGDLKGLSWEKLKEALHIDITDAALTADAMAMMLSRMIQDEMKGA